MAATWRTRDRDEGTYRWNVINATPLSAYVVTASRCLRVKNTRRRIKMLAFAVIVLSSVRIVRSSSYLPPSPQPIAVVAVHSVTAKQTHLAGYDRRRRRRVWLEGSRKVRMARGIPEILDSRCQHRRRWRRTHPHIPSGSAATDTAVLLFTRATRTAFLGKQINRFGRATV